MHSYFFLYRVTMPLIPCLTWVKRGVSKQTPDRVKISKEELKSIIETTKEDLDNMTEDGDDNDDDNGDDDQENGATAGENTIKANKKKRKVDTDVDDDGDIVSKYGLDDYDLDDEDDVNPLDIGGLSFYTSNDEDPNLTVKDSDDSDAEDVEIRSTDNLLAVGKVNEDSCDLIIYVYNEVEGHFFIHHDILLPSFPLAMEWMNYDPAEATPGNLLAIGNMEPVIEIWDLDVIDNLEPSFTLGEKVRKKSKKSKTGACGHTDAILDLSWNHILRTALASASADSTVALWDLTKGTVATSLTQHTDKVQAVQWHPMETQSLLSGGFDKTVKVYDCRNPNDTHKSWSVDGEVENVLWNQFSPMYFYASMDSGQICYFDVRADKPVYTLKAHSSSVTGMALSSQVPGLLVTSSEDKSFKVWDVVSNVKPQHVFSKDMKLGRLFSVKSCPDAAYVFGIGGESDLKVWDIRENESVRTHFNGRSMVSKGESAADGSMETEKDADTLNAMGELTLNKDTTVKTGSTSAKKKKNKKKKGKKPT